MTFRFKDFPVYKLAKEFPKICFEYTRNSKISTFPNLVSQIQRACLSIVLNIAEGSVSCSDTEFARFLNISIRSVHEVVAAFDSASELSLITKEPVEDVEKRVEELTEQLSKFRNSLKVKSNK